MAYHISHLKLSAKKIVSLFFLRSTANRFQWFWNFVLQGIFLEVKEILVHEMVRLKLRLPKLLAQ